MTNLMNFFTQSGIYQLSWQHIGMILIALFLIYIAIVKKLEPLLLLPIGFGVLLANIPGTGLFSEPTADQIGGLLYYLYQGVKLGVYPPLIFLGIGALTDFGPLIANPKTILLGAAAQFGIFTTFFGATFMGFTLQEAASIGIIGGADGPTAIFISSRMAPHLLGVIAIVAYTYIAIIPLIQPPIIKALTSRKERAVEMKQLRHVSQKEKIVFPIMVTVIVGLIVPEALSLVGMLMLGNLLRESGVTKRLADTAGHAFINIITILLMVSVGATVEAGVFFTWKFIGILILGLFAFAISTVAGLLIGKLMAKFSKEKVNPIIGAAGVSAVPAAARLSQSIGLEANPKNHLLMHAMGPNVAGVIGSAVAAGVLLSIFG